MRLGNCMARKVLFMLETKYIKKLKFLLVLVFLCGFTTHVEKISQQYQLNIQSFHKNSEFFAQQGR